MDPVIEAALRDFDKAEPATLQSATKRYAELLQLKRENEEAAADITAEMGQLAPFILEEFAAGGIECQTVNGFTLFPQTELFVNKKAERDGVTTEDVCAALRKCGLGYMTGENYSASSLKSKVKEWRAEGVEVPPELARVLNVSEGVKLSARKA